MFGACMLNSPHGNVIEPTTSISEPESRACRGIVTVLVVPWMASAPCNDTRISVPDVAFAGNVTGEDSTNIACGNCALSIPSVWRWLSRID